MNLQYVTAAHEDVPAIFAQAKDLIDTYEEIASIAYDKVLPWVKQKITDNISQYICVKADGEKCAYYRLCDDGELDDLYVLPGFQSMGIGSAIMQKCIAESPKPLYLYVFSRNTRAISFYTRFGFTVQKIVGNTRLIMCRNG